MLKRLTIHKNGKAPFFPRLGGGANILTQSISLDLDLIWETWIVIFDMVETLWLSNFLYFGLGFWFGLIAGSSDVTVVAVCGMWTTYLRNSVTSHQQKRRSLRVQQWLRRDAGVAPCTSCSPQPPRHDCSILVAPGYLLSNTI